MAGRCTDDHATVAPVDDHIGEGRDRHDEIQQAEIRRAAAVALEQEMKAKVQEMQAKVVESQAQVPLAIADAFRSGRLGVMEYYNLRNLQSDTGMRNAIATASGGNERGDRPA